ncbi:MAG: flagellar basal body-associated FliL family protein [bacterium]|nr:flagellar basal body-associated FliL family protein [bacterium]
MPGPIAWSAIALVVAVALAYWGQRPPSTGMPGEHVGRVSRTRAPLFDGGCVFAADVQLSGRWGDLSFNRNYLDIKKALVALMRTKSRYMVSSPVARESLRLQMVAEVNRVAGRPIAREIQFSQFVVF